MKKRTSNEERFTLKGVGAEFRASTRRCLTAARRRAVAHRGRADRQEQRSNQPKEPPKCENCENSVPAGSLKALTLICNHKAGSDIPWQVIAPDDSCKNFEKSRELVSVDITAALAQGAKLLPLSQNKFAIVDADDYHRLSKYKWCVSKTPHTNYAMRRTKGKRINGKRVKRKTILMHRFIINAPRRLVVDHINHNGLDNRKANLRLCTRAENSRNRRSLVNKSSRYKGVSYDKERKLFIACIRCKGKKYFLGRFKSEIKAAKAYDKKARELFGVYAFLNFPA